MEGLTLELGCKVGALPSGPQYNLMTMRDAS